MEQFGKYVLLRRLATGGMAEVFLAKSAGPMGFEKTVVLKRVLPHLAEDPRFIKMFLSEAKLAARLSHPNVVQIFDFGEHEGEYFLVMEYIDGPTLRAVIRRSEDLKSPLPVGFCLKVISQACEGLAYAHEFCDPDSGQWMGIVHRDISPENILVSTSGTVKVVDFGIAKAAATSTTKSRSLRGKYGYMAPEQLRRKKVDRRVDVYALGIVLYELLTGQRPWNAVGDVALMRAIMTEPIIPPSVRRPSLHKELDEILSRALDRKDDRYPTCHELQADLEEFLVEHRGSMSAQQLSKVLTELDVVPRRISAIMPAVSEGAKPTREDLQAGTPPLPEPTPARTPSDQSNPQDMTVPYAHEAQATRTQSQTINEPFRGRWLLTAALASLLIGGLALALRREPPSGPTGPPEPPKPIAPRPKPEPKPEPVALASLRIDCEPPGYVRVLGQVIGFSPVTLEGQKPGALDVEVYEPQLGFSKHVTFNVEPGDNGLRRILVEHVPVEFQVPRGTSVAVDGRLIGRAPLAGIRLYEGLHEIRLMNRQRHQDVKMDFAVEPGHPNVFRYSP